MGTFSCPVEVFAADGSRTVTVAAAVDTGSTYTCLPAELLRELGAAPSRRIQFELADGSVIEDEIGEVRVRLQGIELNTIVVFVEEGAAARLGAYTLTGALLIADPVGQRLVPDRSLRPSRREATVMALHGSGAQGGGEIRGINREVEAMEKQDLGVAVVGSGRIGTLRANMAARHPSVRFLAVSDIDPERAGRLGEQVGADFTASDNYRIIAHPEVNAVVVSTPEHEHLEPILQALELGKPVFVEKPLALTLEDTDRIVAAVDRTGVEVRIGYSRRHDRRWMLAKEQIAQGRLGGIIGIQSRVYNSRAHMMEILKRSPEATPVLDALTYYVDMACWYLEGNRPTEVIARGNYRLYREMGYDIHDVTWAVISFEDGCLVNLGICYALPARYPTYGQSARFEVLGEDGVIILDMDNKDSFLFTDRGVPHAYVPDHNVDALFMQSNSSGDWAMGEYWGPIANETRSWLDHLAAGTPCSHTTVREGRRTVEVTLAIEAAARSGKAVAISER